MFDLFSVNFHQKYLLLDKAKLDRNGRHYGKPRVARIRPLFWLAVPKATFIKAEPKFQNNSHVLNNMCLPNKHSLSILFFVLLFGNKYLPSECHSYKLNL